MFKYKPTEKMHKSRFEPIRCKRRSQFVCTDASQNMFGNAHKSGIRHFRSQLSYCFIRHI